MPHRIFSGRFVGLMPFFALLLWICGVGEASFAAPRGRIDNSLKRMAIPGTKELELIVVLSDPSVLDRLQTAHSFPARDTRSFGMQQRRSLLSSAQAASHRQDIRRGQEFVKKQIEAIPGARVMGATSTLMNAVILRVPLTQYRAVQKLAGTRKVYFSRPRKLMLDTAATMQKAQSMWAIAGGKGSTGQGIRIGILDSGIDMSNPMFSGTGMTAPAGFSPATTTSGGILDGTHMNGKVIVARSYVSSTVEDQLGHGTFVAGCAAGAQVDAPRAAISGMAPGAYLGVYKILETSTTTSAAEISALDDAVADGMDVINMSIGALDYLPPEEEVEYEAITRAIQAGIVVTVSAGNEGTSTQTISSPATIPEVIAVGSVTNSREFSTVVKTNNPNMSTIEYTPSADGPQVNSDPIQTSVKDAANLNNNELGCSAFSSGSLANSLVLIKRGTCYFLEKVTNAANAGAVGVIVYNNEAEGTLPMGQLNGTTIPAVMISNSDGLAFKQYIDTNPSTAKAAISLSVTAVTGGILSDFSSVGPGSDFSIKPDLVAVGENVYSATQKTATSGTMYDGTGFQANSGTSFSSPIVAGAAAGLIQKFPTLGVAGIKSMLANTASRNITVDGINRPNVLQAGSGLLDMEAAVNATAVFFPSSLSFGVHSYDGTLSLQRTLTVRNISNASDQFTFGFEPVVAGPSVSFSSNSTGTMSSGASANIIVVLQSSAPSTGGFQGFITATSSSTGFVYRIPYWAGLYASDATRILKVSQAGTGDYTSLADAIASAQPGNIIEITDSSSYSAGDLGLVITTNRQGLPLHGLTIRAASGQAPVIQATDYSTGIRIVGLKNVRLQGLHINGGYTGLDLWQPSSSIPLSVTIDRCTVSNAFPGYEALGIWIGNGGTIDITGSMIRGSTGSGIVASGGGHLTMIGTTVQGNAYDGLEANSADLFISNSTFFENSSSAIYLDNSTGTITSSSVRMSRTGAYPGNGIEIFGGNLAISNNLIESNAFNGMDIYGDPRVKIVGNKIRLNGAYGVSFDSVTDAALDRNLIEDNASGVYLGSTSNALLTNNIIVRSTNVLNGDGVRVDGTTTAHLVNNTIYRNAEYGVRRLGGAVTIANSILSSNTSGSFSGVDSSAILNSPTMTDPKFINANSDDFSLASGSPAIDAGSNAVDNLPFLDYYGKARVSSSGTFPGQGTVDIGAVESSSAYPLIYPLIVNGTDSVLGTTFTTGFAFLNPSSTAANFSFAGFDSNGAKISGTKNPYSPDNPLNPQGQIPILGWQMFGFGSDSAVRGSVLGAAETKAAGIGLLADPDFKKFNTGVNATTNASTDLVFMRHQSGSGLSTSYIITNPGVNGANITANLINTDGTTVATQTATVAAKGQTILKFGSGSASGYVRVSSDRPVSGWEVVGNANIAAALGGFSPAPQARLFFPQFAVGGNYKTQIGIINTSALSASLTLTAYDGDGNLIDTLDSLELAPGAQLLKTVTELFGISDSGPLQTGYLVAQSDVEGIMGFTDFAHDDGIVSSDATIPADFAPGRKLLFSQVAHGVLAGNLVPSQTGIALLNPFGTDVQFTMSLYDGSGNLVNQTTQTIAPHQRVAKVLAYPMEGVSFFNQALVMGNGHVEVTSDYGLLGAELFYTEDLSQLTSVPAQVIE